MTNQVELLTNTVSVTTHITPQVVAYDFKQWAGVIGTIATTIYTAGHIIYSNVVREGGLRKIWSNFMGPKQVQEEAPKQENKQV